MALGLEIWSLDFVHGCLLLVKQKLDMKRARTKVKAPWPCTDAPPPPLPLTNCPPRGSTTATRLDLYGQHLFPLVTWCEQWIFKLFSFYLRVTWLGKNIGTALVFCAFNYKEKWSSSSNEPSFPFVATRTLPDFLADRVVCYVSLSTPIIHFMFDPNHIADNGRKPQERNRFTHKVQYGTNRPMLQSEFTFNEPSATILSV